ncbi:HD family hydrolase [Catellatospora bangladeshensis]|uniref:5'-deoxynucleotidase n=1 Tax=Catellatospora bangladeshensis TaxID=310355 RepID=A0A8J3JGI7_9ACTN|nr:HD domain-containing protein [Catellatospora bangladeshensis]GIF84482.1 haloacid dehalogenase [Catellatospora bangladeshensis]
MDDAAPARAADEAKAAGLAQLAFELGVLKSMRRAGWWHAGIRDPESVAEHSLRVAQLASLIAAEEGADPARAAMMAIWHDSQETRTGDLPHTARAYLSKPDPQKITADQTAALPDRAAMTVREAVAEYESQETAEAVCAHDADKLECLLQAVEYRMAGNAAVEGWIISSRNALRTETAKSIAEAALTISPLKWRNR